LCHNGIDVVLWDPPAEDAGLYPAITLDRDGQPLITFYNATQDWLQVLRCLNYNGACDGEPPVYLTTGGVYSSVTVGADGLPIISFYDTLFDADNLSVAHCSDPTCAQSVLVTVDSADDTGTESSITIGTDGLPLISYFDVTMGALKAMHCSNPFCLPYYRRR
jgi:hypothetical protein